MRRSPWAAFLAVVFALAAATPAAAIVSTGHSGWSWANPTPQGEDVNDVAFSGATGYAVGGFGTLLRSTDGGATWTGLPSRTVQGLTRVVPAPGGFVASGACAVRRSADDGATVSTIDVGGGDTGCGTDVAATAFADASSGAILFANGVILTTGDGGVSLSRRTPVPGGPATDIVATAPGTFFATSGNGIQRSVDGGGSWTLVALQTRTLRSLTFATPSVAYAVGDSGTVLRSSDGGAGWAPVTSPGGDANLSRLRCADALLCLGTISGSGTLVRTIDGGTTWTRVTASGRAIRSVAFASPTRVVAVGDGGSTVISDDGGATWRPVGGTVEGTPTTIAAVGAGFGYAVGPTSIALTTDAGATWRSVGIPTPLTIGSASFADPSTGFAQDAGGTIRRTRDGGVTWQVVDPGAGVAGPVRILATGGGRVLLIAAGGVSRSTDGGETFRRVPSAVVTAARGVRARILGVAGAGRTAFIIGRAGILRSTDAGARWTRVPLPRVARRPPTIAAADCAAPATCWILTTGSRAYRTINAGRRWTEVTASIGVPLRDIGAVAADGPRSAFLALRGFTATGSRGLVLHTSDGGRSWDPQLLGSDPLTSIDAGGGTALALTGLGRIFTTSTGGRTAVASALTITARAVRASRGRARVTVSGRLRGAEGGEQVTLYVKGQRPRTIAVASSDTFSASYLVRLPATFTAQWEGDGVRSGDGTPALVVRTARRR